MSGDNGTATANGRSLKMMPVGLFASVMGIVGLGLVWGKAAEVLGTPRWIADALIMLSAGVYAVLLAAFIMKWRRHPDAVIAEYRDPARTGFYSAIPIGALLISAGWCHYWPAAAGIVFWVCAVSLVALSALMAVRLLTEETPFDAVNGSWMIGMVSPILVPLAGNPLGYMEMSHFCLSVGFAMWIVVFPIIMARLFFGAPTPPGLRPTWFILVVPPMIIFLGYVSFNGGSMDFFARALYYLGLFLVIALIIASRDIAKWPFTVAWWGFTFPLDGAAAAALTYHKMMASPASQVMTIALLALASFTVAFVAMRTIAAFAAGTLLLPPPVPEPRP